MIENENVSDAPMNPDHSTSADVEWSGEISPTNDEEFFKLITQNPEWGYPIESANPSTLYDRSKGPASSPSDSTPVNQLKRRRPEYHDPISKPSIFDLLDLASWSPLDPGFSQCSIHESDLDSLDVIDLDSFEESTSTPDQNPFILTEALSDKEIDSDDNLQPKSRGRKRQIDN